MTKASPTPAAGDDQLLHLVFGGELEKVDSHRFSDLKTLDIVGIYPNYRTALAAWRGKAQASVDNARMRYYVVHLHRLLDPGLEERAAKQAEAGSRRE
jgi:hypothetical protein